jgi:hypothetical protein
MRDSEAKEVLDRYVWIVAGGGSLRFPGSRFVGREGRPGRREQVAAEPLRGIVIRKR